MKPAPFARRLPFTLMLAGLFAAIALPSLCAQSSSKQSERKPNGLERFAKALFGNSNQRSNRNSQRVRTATPAPAPSRTVIYDVRAAQPAPVAYTVDPAFQNDGSPGRTVLPPDAASQTDITMTRRGDRGQITLPVTPGMTSAPRQSIELGSVDQTLNPSSSLSQATPIAPPAPVAVKMPLPPVPEHPVYGLPVRGRPGFVHPPSPTGETKYIIDVRGISAGEMMRDPWTGQVFLVPPA